MFLLFYSFAAVSFVGVRKQQSELGRDGYFVHPTKGITVAPRLEPPTPALVVQLSSPLVLS